MKHAHRWVLTSALLILGCDDDDHRSTAVGESGPRPPSALATDTMPAQPTRAFTWNLPQGWHEDVQQRPMRQATAYTSADADKRAEVVVTRLPGSFGDPLGNFNRWRSQVELPPADKIDAGEKLSLPAGEAKLFEMQGSQRAQLIAHVVQGESNWFIKLIGPREEVQQQKAAFLELLKSLKFE